MIKMLYTRVVHACVALLTLHVVLILCFAGLCCVVSPLSQVEASHRAKKGNPGRPPPCGSNAWS